MRSSRRDFLKMVAGGFVAGLVMRPAAMPAEPNQTATSACWVKDFAGNDWLCVATNDGAIQARRLS